jgi:hypothetical protein
LKTCRDLVAENIAEAIVSRAREMQSSVKPDEMTEAGYVIKIASLVLYEMQVNGFEPVGCTLDDIKDEILKIIC